MLEESALEAFRYRDVTDKGGRISLLSSSLYLSAAGIGPQVKGAGYGLGANLGFSRRGRRFGFFAETSLLFYQVKAVDKDLANLQLEATLGAEIAWTFPSLNLLMRTGLTGLHLRQQARDERLLSSFGLGWQFAGAIELDLAEPLFLKGEMGTTVNLMHLNSGYTVRIRPNASVGIGYRL